MAHKILAVDDHPETLNIVVTTLERHGYEVISTQSPIKSLHMAEEEMPHLFLIDMMMPDMDGVELCRRLRAMPQFATTPILMFTAIDDAEQKLAGFDAGVDDYLTKPTEPDEMIARVRMLLETANDTGIHAIRIADTKATGDSADLSQPLSPLTTSGLLGEQHLVAVVGSRGGCGATTTAVNLAVSMAELGCRTTLVDLDMVQGHIALYLNQKSPSRLNIFSTMSDEELPKLISQHSIRYHENLELLLAHPNLDGRYPKLSPHQAGLLVETLIQTRQCVVVDVGLGITEVSQAILERANQIIVCLRPERVALSAARRLLKQLQDMIFPDTSLNALLMDFGESGKKLPKEVVESFLGHTLLGIMVVSTKDMTKSINKGLSLIKVNPGAKSSLLFKKLAHQIVKP